MSTVEELFDPEALTSYFEAELGPSDGDLELEPLEGGNANETYRFVWGGRDLVLRRASLGEPGGDMMHNTLREYRMKDALTDTWVPTPEVYLGCDDEDVIGVPFYVMEYVEGDIVLEAPPERFQTPTQRELLSEEVTDTLAKLHNIDHERVGLSEMARDPASFHEWQIAEWMDRLDESQAITGEVREIPELYELGEWLRDNVPEISHEAGIFHGDFRPHNILFEPGTPPRAVALVDWEMSSVGDPLADLGWLLSYWMDDSDPSPLTDDFEERYGYHELYPEGLEAYLYDFASFMLDSDFYSRREIVERYERQTGIEYEHDVFYRAMARFKLAVVFDGLFMTVLEEVPGAEQYSTMEITAPVVAKQGQLIISGDTPL